MLEFDARTSDGIVLAIRAQAPVFVEEHVLARVDVEIRQSAEVAAEDFDEPLNASPREESVQQPADDTIVPGDEKVRAVSSIEEAS